MAGTAGNYWQVLQVILPYRVGSVFSSTLTIIAKSIPIQCLCSIHLCKFSPAHKDPKKEKQAESDCGDKQGPGPPRPGVSVHLPLRSGPGALSPRAGLDTGGFWVNLDRPCCLYVFFLTNWARGASCYDGCPQGDVSGVCVWGGAFSGQVLLNH